MERNKRQITARRCAYQVIHRVTQTNGYAHDMFNEYISHVRLSGQDKAFARLLVLGVVATVGTLDECIDRALRSPSDVNQDVRDALRISTYEIIFLKKDSYAAVNEGVELVKGIAPRAGGLANACLRKIAQQAQRFPFSDPAASDEALARQYGFPFWLARGLIKDIGREDAGRFMQASNEQAPLYVCINTLVAKPCDVLAVLQASGCNPVEIDDASEFLQTYLLKTPAGIADGRVQQLLKNQSLIVSDLSAQTVTAAALDDVQGRSFLEIGSGRGTKSILLQIASQAKWGAQLDLSCVDLHAFKNELLRERARKSLAKVNATYAGDARNLGALLPQNARYDGILIDAPCSGLGTLRRHPEIRWRIQESAIDELAQTGLAMLKSASAFASPGGIITYSTCTVTAQENQQVVLSFLDSPEGSRFSLIPFKGSSCFAGSLQPGGPDAHFAVRLKCNE